MEVTNDGARIAGTVRIVNSCGRCGTRLTGHTFPIDVVVEDAAQHLLVCKEASDEFDFDAYVVRAIWPSLRGWSRHGHGYELVVTLTCQCGDQFGASFYGNIKAAAMDRLV